MTHLAWLTDRIRHEYESLPGLKITEAQACRLWSVDEETCQAALKALATEGYLWRAPSGRYVALPKHAGATVAAAEQTARCPHCGKRNTFPTPQSSEARIVSMTLRCDVCHRPINIMPAA